MVLHCNLDKDVILVGMGNIIELWSAKKYGKFLIDDSHEFSKLAQKYLDE
jgi:MraZ protein